MTDKPKMRDRLLESARWFEAHDDAIRRARRGESGALEYGDPTTVEEAQESDRTERVVAAGLGDLPGWLLNLGPVARVSCDSCGSVLAEVWPRDVTLTGKRIVALVAVAYSPPPVEVGELFAWYCLRCRGGRGLNAGKSAAAVREGWRERDASLTTADVRAKVELRATPARLS